MNNRRILGLILLWAAFGGSRLNTKFHGDHFWPETGEEFYFDLLFLAMSTAGLILCLLKPKPPQS